VSAEIFVVCRGFKAPQRLDPKFLDPRSVFEELPDPTPNAEAKVFHPEKRKRQREGYEDGDYTFYKEVSAMTFIETQDPIQLLSSTSRITWSDDASRKLLSKELTIKEIVACSEDLKVLGKKDFRNLLKWRLAMREDLGLSSKKEESVERPTETVTVTEDDQIDAEMARLSAQDAASKKRERRKLNERKQKEITRMQLGMLTPRELGMEQDTMATDEIFGLKNAEQSGSMQGFLNGAIPEGSEEESEDEVDEESGSENDIDDLEDQLDTMYDRYQERKAEMNAKFRAKRAREEVEEWDGLDQTNGNAEGASSSNSDSESDSDEEPENPVDSLLTTLGTRLDARQNGQLSKRATLFFDRPDFEGIDIDEPQDDPTPDESPEAKVPSQESEGEVIEDSASDDGFEEAPANVPEPDPWGDDSDDEKSVRRPGIFLSCLPLVT
jgi:AdoMet-dependent rRNA methyltransferase SPB1